MPTQNPCIARDGERHSYTQENRILKVAHKDCHSLCHECKADTATRRGDVTRKVLTVLELERWFSFLRRSQLPSRSHLNRTSDCISHEKDLTFFCFSNQLLCASGNGVPRSISRITTYRNCGFLTMGPYNAGFYPRVQLYIVPTDGERMVVSVQDIGLPESGAKVVGREVSWVVGIIWCCCVSRSIIKGNGQKSWWGKLSTII